MFVIKVFIFFSLYETTFYLICFMILFFTYAVSKNQITFGVFLKTILFYQDTMFCLWIKYYTKLKLWTLNFNLTS